MAGPRNPDREWLNQHRAKIVRCLGWALGIGPNEVLRRLGITEPAELRIPARACRVSPARPAGHERR